MMKHVRYEMSDCRPLASRRHAALLLVTAFAQGVAYRAGVAENGGRHPCPRLMQGTLADLLDITQRMARIRIERRGTPTFICPVADRNKSLALAFVGGYFNWRRPHENLA
jgi:hypothetical protein